jgi:hypothetical protein
MGKVEQAVETQLKNIQAKTGKTLEQLADLVRASGLEKHGEIRDFLKGELGLGFGDANAVAHACRKGEGGGPDAPAAAPEAAPSSGDLYTGPKAALRPIHDSLIEAVESFGPFEISPKKGYWSLRRKKQFAMVGPATQNRVEVGINAKGLAAAERLAEVPAGGMCQYKVRLGDVLEVDEELIGWLRQAYDAAG